MDGDNDALDLPEATSIMLMMLFAGHETTTNLLGNSFHRLLADRASWEAICCEPSLIPNAIEEVLRFDSSVITWRHKAKQAVDIGGVSVPAEAKLCSCSDRLTAIRPSLRTLIASTSGGRMRVNICHSDTACTTASARRSHGWRRAWSWRRSADACRPCVSRGTRRSNFLQVSRCVGRCSLKVEW